MLHGMAKTNKQTNKKTNETVKLRISFKGAECIFGTQKRGLTYKAILFSLPFNSWSDNPELFQKRFLWLRLALMLETGRPVPQEPLATCGYQVLTMWLV